MYRFPYSSNMNCMGLVVQSAFFQKKNRCVIASKNDICNTALNL